MKLVTLKNTTQITVRSRSYIKMHFKAQYSYVSIHRRGASQTACSAQMSPKCKMLLAYLSKKKQTAHIIHALMLKSEIKFFLFSLVQKVTFKEDNESRW
jgi:hypothetical protein